MASPIPSSLTSGDLDIDIDFSQATEDFTYDPALIEWMAEHAQRFVAEDVALDHFRGSVLREKSPSPSIPKEEIGKTSAQKILSP